MECLSIRKALVAFAALVGVCAYADLDGSYVVPLDHPAIQYATRPVADRIAGLQRQLRNGKLKLAHNNTRGYLEAVLKALNVPTSSQILVFSKTSFQAPRISPQRPRSLYFNDDVFVGWVPGGDVLELASVDPRQGVVFYTMDQGADARPAIDRRDDCLQCHQTGATVGVPGLVVRSLYVERSGEPIFRAGGFITDHRSPLSERWGGYYVTGTHGEQRHMGNVFARDLAHPENLDREQGANVTDLKSRLYTGTYLEPTSDIVALMTLEHQTRMINLLTRVGWETRVALADQRRINLSLKEPADAINDGVRHRIDNAVETLLKYMLFTDEALLDAPVHGVSHFAEEFERQGPSDHVGRSLRELDLTGRMFRYPCSFLIYSAEFDALPPMARDRVYRRLWEILTGVDQTPAYARLVAADRKAIYEILLDTKSNLPDYWTGRPTSVKTSHP